MNVTERVIREQFPFWTGALDIALPAPGAGLNVVVGCGTSYYLALSIAATFNRRGHRAIAVPGAEWSRHRDSYPAGEDVTVIALSRSGESSETVQAVETSRKAGLRTIAITCAEGSSIARAAETVVFAPTHPAEGIVMTSSASLMLLIGLRMAGIVFDADIADAAERLMETADRDLSRIIQGRSHFVYLGSGALYGLATEGALKLQEMSLSYSQAFHPMEYRHGPISLVDDATFVVALYNEDTAAEEAGVIRDVRDKGAFVLAFGGPGDLSLDVPAGNEARALAVLPALQILGERVAEMRGADTEAPRHLSKVVVLA
ncbi:MULTISPECIES: SIS domain-containing protein [unclassified Aureimonas]|uniref:SIS domain-containing protein n=1 Tax=unclassified Aureimonas TaxID=2615206 RepID=UPI0006FA981D|nr:MULTISPECIES: SIS domain-containing protein [unclassified Aureimonas]KQT65775.1 glucosamine-fructose-6-phosphate aminotransferase [Aureimonas sp. Leaf427]KQT74774.1 glucosamine-fructose-6-phosphate aminotransferase [Aureimonas sp. Leaf460]